MMKTQQKNTGKYYPHNRQKKRCNVRIFNSKTELKKTFLMNKVFLWVDCFCHLFVTRILMQNILISFEIIVVKYGGFVLLKPSLFLIISHNFSRFEKKKTAFHFISHNFYSRQLTLAFYSWKFTITLHSKILTKQNNIYHETL